MSASFACPSCDIGTKVPQLERRSMDNSAPYGENTPLNARDWRDRQAAYTTGGQSPRTRPDLSLAWRELRRRLLQADLYGTAMPQPDRPDCDVVRPLASVTLNLISRIVMNVGTAV